MRMTILLTTFCAFLISCASLNSGDSNPEGANAEMSLDGPSLDASTASAETPAGGELQLEGTPSEPSQALNEPVSEPPSLPDLQQTPGMTSSLPEKSVSSWDQHVTPPAPSYEEPKYEKPVKKSKKISKKSSKKNKLVKKDKKSKKQLAKTAKSKKKVAKKSKAECKKIAKNLKKAKKQDLAMCKLNKKSAGKSKKVAKLSGSTVR